MNYLKLFRFPLVFTAMADSAAGYLVAVGGGSPRLLTLILLAIASGGLYGFGMALNDVADRDRDRKLHPGRVLPAGKLTLAQAEIACAVALLISGVAVAAIGVAGVAGRMGVWAGIAALIVLYDYALKVAPAMGMIRALNVLLGASVLGFGRPELLLWLGLPSFVYGTALTFVSTQEEKGPRRLWVWVGALLMVCGASLPGMIQPGAIVWIASGVLGVWVLRRAYRATTIQGVMLLVRDGVAGYIVLDAAIVLSYGHVVRGIAVALLLIPAAVCVAVFKRA